MRKMRKNAAGIDIDAKEIFVAIENQKVKSFTTFTDDFIACSNYLL